MVDQFSTVRVVVVSGMRNLREGVAALLRGADGLEAIAARPGEAADRIAAARQDSSRGRVPDEGLTSTAAAGVRRSSPAHGVVALVDHLLPNLPSIVARLAARAPVVVFGVPERDAAVIACAEAGAVASVPVDASRTELREVVLAAARNEPTRGEESSLVALLMRRLAALSLRGDDALPGASGEQGVALTLRQREIAQLLERGFNNKQIAARLGIAASTVRGHVHKLLGNLHVHRPGETTAQFRSWLASILALPPLPADSASR